MRAQDIQAGGVGPSRGQQRMSRRSQRQLQAQQSEPWGSDSGEEQAEESTRSKLTQKSFFVRRERRKDIEKLSRGRKEPIPDRVTAWPGGLRGTCFRALE